MPVLPAVFTVSVLIMAMWRVGVPSVEGAGSASCVICCCG